ncbi:hypothetical protein ACF0H5_002757 [Mactra antiquata]
MSLSKIRTVVSTHWLRDQISSNVQKQASKKLRILDTSFVTDRSADMYSECYMMGHIPQSLHFSLFQCVESTPEILVNLPDEKCFNKYVRSLGVWSDTHVVAYDRFGPLSSFKTWWLFRAFGHKNISILDGGLKKWLDDGYDVTTEEPDVEEGDFVGKLNKDHVKTYNDIIDIVTTNKAQLVDARSPTSTTVADETYGGAIKGSKHVNFFAMFNEDGTYKSKEELQNMFTEAGVNLNEPMVATCYRALTATGVIAAAHILGKEDVPLYIGSWSEFSQRAPDHLTVRGKANIPES